MSGRGYPRADRSEWHGQANYAEAGGVMVMMPPERFLASVRPLVMDDLSRENVDDLAGHIISGGVLDPLVIFDDGKEDGRHRAHAAIGLGIAAVPVLLFGAQIGRFADLAPVPDDPDQEGSPGP